MGKFGVIASCTLGKLFHAYRLRICVSDFGGTSKLTRMRADTIDPCWVFGTRWRTSDFIYLYFISKHFWYVSIHEQGSHKQPGPAIIKESTKCKRVRARKSTHKVVLV